MTKRIHDRATYIGSYDAFAIATGKGLKKLWLEKTGRAEREDLSGNFKVQLGSYTEPLHLDWMLPRAAEAYGWQLKARKNDHQEHAAETFGFKMPVLSTLDCMVSAWSGDATEIAMRLPVEVKHSSSEKSLHELIDFYMPQIQHHAMCADVPNVLFSAILGNNEPEFVMVGRDDAWIARYAELVHEFIRCLKSDTPPMPLSIESETARATEVPTVDTIPLDGQVVLDASTDNNFVDAAHSFITDKDAHDRFVTSKDVMKDRLNDKTREAFAYVATPDGVRMRVRVYKTKGGQRRLDAKPAPLNLR